MKYIKRTYKAGNTIEVQKTYSAVWGKSLSKAGKTGKSKLSVKQYNDKVAVRNCTRLINANFKPKDLFLTLTYRRGSNVTPEEAQKHREKFLRNLRNRFSRNNKELHYIGTIGIGERGAIHHHIIIDSMDPRELPQLWVHGRVDCQPLHENREYSKLAAYICHQNREIDGKRISGKRWYCSKNLIKPQAIVEEVSAKEWREPPQPIKGYIIDTDSVEAGFNPLTGIPYLFYRMIKIPPKSRVMAADGRLLKADEAEKWLQQQNQAEIKAQHKVGRWKRAP